MNSPLDETVRAFHIELRSSALDLIRDGIWLAETSGEILCRNPVAETMERMFWSRGGAIGTMEDVVIEPVTRLIDGREHFNAEFHLTGEIDEERNVVLEIHRIYQPAGLLLHARDVSNEWLREQTLQDRHVELEQAYRRLKETQIQLLQAEKMASIGQLAAGVAHEINNPIGYVHSNLGTLKTYVDGLMLLLDSIESRQNACEPGSPAWEAGEDIRRIKQQIDYAFLREDLPNLLTESLEGIERVKKIVLDLRDFSHIGQADTDAWVQADLHHAIESAINIVWNELKYKASIRRDFNKLPLIECIPSQLNQVFLNLLINAGQAITTSGDITVSTRLAGNNVCASVRDNGSGMSADVRKRVFDPFFTTKPVGKGTGLGLSLSYGIIKNHNGRIEVDSQPGEGSEFRVFLPIRQPAGPGT